MRHRAVVTMILLVVSLQCPLLLAEKRFDRHVIKLQNPKEYQYFKLDDVNFPVLANSRYSVSCLVYRGTQRYYVEVAIQNRTAEEVTLAQDFITFSKPSYTVFRTDTATAAQDVAASVGGEFVPAPPPQVQGKTTTTFNANASTYGNRTDISGVATTSTDQSAQAGANLGNAIGNVIAARSFYKTRRRESTFANFLYAFAQNQQPSMVHPGETKLIVATFEQAKQKKAPFEVVIRFGLESFSFKFKE
jgi:hypothetical protein